jgi:isocitrate lyase
MAKYLETVYVSGWQSSSTASSTNEPGPDLAGALGLPSFSSSSRSRLTLSILPPTDYPSNTVPLKVTHLFQAQLFHDRYVSFFLSTVDLHRLMSLRSRRVESNDMLD